MRLWRRELEGLKRILYAAAIVSLGSLTLWTLADHWLSLLIITVVIVAAVLILGRKKSG